MRRAFLTLWREGGWRTSFGSLLGICTLLQFLLLGLLGAAAAQTLLLADADLKIEIRADANRGEVQQLFSTLQSLPSVERAVYITREQALERIKTEDPALATFFEKFNVQNPFPDTIGITLRTLADYSAFSAFLSESRWQQVIDISLLSSITHQEERVRELLRVVGGGRNLAAILLLLSCAILLMTIVELTRNSALQRADQVMVERLIGANNRTIGLPFFWEATILLLMSIVLSSIILWIFLLILPTLVPALSDNGALASFSGKAEPLLTTLLPTVLVSELLLAPLLSGLGTWLGLRPSLR